MWRNMWSDICPIPQWWRHQMEIFSALLALCAGNSSVTGEFPTQRPVTRSFDVFFDLHLIKLLSKHSRGWWFETLSCPWWRHRNDYNTGQDTETACLDTTLSDLIVWQVWKCWHVHTSLRVYIYGRIYIYIYIYVCMYVCICLCMCIYTYISTYVYVYVCVTKCLRDKTKLLLYI